MFLLAALGAAPAAAGWNAGAGVIVADRPYAGQPRKFIPLPMVSYRGPRFSVQGPHAAYKVWGFGPFGASVLLEYRFDGFDADDSPALSGMATRRGTLEGGLELKLPVPLPGRLMFNVALRGDLLSAHDGAYLNAGLSRRFAAGAVSLIPSAGATLRNGPVNRYYYGVRPEEARAGRPAYAPGASASPRLGLTVLWKTGESWAATLAARTTLLDGAIQASPIVSRSTLSNVFLALIHTF